mmetsp:Transcript_13544/g.29442  ORF Transcript_13544/g.29442 Transcript_13544/m.29442 type:complete len:457 (-) Transcript_13544:319-1689(-)|eukprot:CAMPEP_0172309342 /NCGR_PEP_ID=MMETSP1058-20130122/9663_1 /TAXON_ID=83371 /ORGANISM="Detonula confervacea, Strain CCMP 353" /LENGTH=456 /DNA_ID=CAMNT_0013021953 /DNA_START=134 /DNA_END=1504 /DNA_ORIENTATION=-
MLSVGRFVKIHSLASEKAKKHNGKTAIVKTPIDNDTGRCGIQPVGGSETNILAIKASNLTILCSFCKMKEEETAPNPISCERCKKVSYCSKNCKKKHWEGANRTGSGIVNCHKSWCIPIQFEMEVPTQPIGESNVGEDVFEEIAQYLQLAVDVGNSGRRSEERVMLEKLIQIDKKQPSAYHNLFHSCSQLAVVAERYHPDDYEELAFKAIRYLSMGIGLLISHAGEPFPFGGKLDGPNEQMYKAMINTINDHALEFIEGCMRGERGAGNAKLENIEHCLIGILVMFDQNKQPICGIHATLGFCFQKLTKYEDAAREFEVCCKKSKRDTQWYHTSLVQMPQCLSCVALYCEDKSPAERIDVMERAVAKFNEAIAVLKAEDPKNVYSCQAKLSRCLFNKNSMLNQFSQREEAPYPDQQKERLKSLMCETATKALEGALAANDMEEVQAMESLQGLPFV